MQNEVTWCFDALAFSNFKEISPLKWQELEQRDISAF